MIKGKDFKSLVKEKILVLDGAAGTLLQSYGLPPDAPPEIAQLRMPDKLEKAHRAYVEAGADIILTNTFGASPIRLREYQLDPRTDEINIEAVKIARSVAGEDVLVGASVGPSGAFLQPIGSLTFDQAYENYLQQGKALAQAKPDLIVLETFSDIRGIKAATIAMKDAFIDTEMPIIAHMTFAEDGRTVTGTDPLSFVVVMEALGCAAVGVNCSVGPKEMIPIAQEICRRTHLPVSVEPNAGLPHLVDGRAVFDLSAPEFARHIDSFLDAGVNIMGSCCGSTPEFTKLIAAKVKNRKPITRESHDYLRLAGRTRTVVFKDTEPIRPIGERINPAGRKRLKAELQSGEMKLVRKEAMQQEEAKAAAIDINVSAHKVDEKVILKKAVRTVQAASSLPVVLDSSDTSALEEALKTVEGKALINSTSGQQEKLEQIIPLAKKYGAAVIGICLDEKGIPDTAEERIKIGRRILDFGIKNGLPAKDIILDGLVLTVSTGAEKLQITFETLKRLKNELKVCTVLGISNSSFGMPNRPAINSTALALALENGLDIPIVDPLDIKIKDTLYSFNLIKGKDLSGNEYINEMQSRSAAEMEIAESRQKQRKEQEADIKMGPLALVKKLIIDGERDSIEDAVVTAVREGFKPLEIVNTAVIPAMAEVGDLFEAKKYFLPQVILSAETMKTGFALLKERFDSSVKSESRGTIVFATVKGDVHDLGKNIVITLLESYGYDVIDLGKSVECERIIESAVEKDASWIALSSLMTTTMGEMKRVAETAKKKDVDIPIIIGGAVISREYADEIGASYAGDALDAVRVISKK